MVRVKFKVTEIIENESGHKVKLSPVTTGSEENKEFFKYTPFGSMEMGFISEETAKKFNVGDDFYIDLTPAPKV